MRIQQWHSAQEDEDYADPDSTPEPEHETKEIRVCVLF